MSESRQEPELTQLEAMFRELIPQNQLNRDRLLFDAGRASVPRRKLPFVPLTTAFVGIVLGIVAGRYWFSVPGRMETKFIRIPVASKQSPKKEQPPQELLPQKQEPKRQIQIAKKRESPRQSTSYLGLRDQVLRWGPGILPSPPKTFELGEQHPPTVFKLYSDWIE